MTLRFSDLMRRGWPWVLALLAGLALPARAQQTVRVSGTISAFDSREAIPGASVRVMRTRVGQAAGLKGEFEIDARPTDTLLFRAVGFRSRLLPLGGTGISQLIIQVQLQRDSVRLSEVRVISDRPDRAMINRALRNMKRPVPPVVSGAKRPPRPKPMFPVDSSAPKAPTPTLESPLSLIYEQLSREGKQRKKVRALEAVDQAEKARQARAKYNKAFKDNRGYEP
ncbi:carboxypeptidase-like regulatory domain-containing protein [Hymenobacter nivis]|uniref:Carboxypeptidase-like regulatory domain-containing protein n=1 Tax=Hymenobacter nivis TaxID=1850093 RepID=A0A502HGC3_9BACT|nr:carboxypeptidase-like regulatory domain-containing protein [Hymenobacter nivis]TPG72426.1 carboxypeptidase-like regulatory domain-containing protein [Hymenobacter nivis]